MPTPTPKNDYARLAELLEALATAAKDEDWEQMLQLQEEQEQLVERLRSASPLSPRDQAQRAQLATLIERALAGLRAAQPRLDALREQASASMNHSINQRKVAQLYR